MPKVVYVTGAPAAGKSSTIRMLVEGNPSLRVWEYGDRLTEYLASRMSGVTSQRALRKLSGAVVTPEDVASVDLKLLEFVEANRANRSVIIDSHPVTKEAYGFRITPFSLDQFAKLNPDEIWVLYSSPKATRDRIAADAAGRPLVDEEEARFHTYLQAAVAATYGMSLGRPVHLFDTMGPREELLRRLAERLG